MTSQPEKLMRLSVAMATFNGAAHLQAQLDSLVAQTRHPDELVIRDDGSTDDTVAIARRFAATAPFSVDVLVNESNLGCVGNFDAALRACSGEVLLLCDQDDVWDPTKLARLESILAEHPDVLLTINDARIVDGLLDGRGVTQIGQLRALRMQDPLGSFTLGCCTAIRRELLPLVSPTPQPHFGHDTWMHALARLLGVRLVIDESLQRYRRHVSNASDSLPTSVRPLRQIDLIRSYGSEDPREWCARRLGKLEALTERLAERGEFVLEPIGLADRLAPAMSALSEERDAVHQRLAHLSRHRVGRVLPALSMLRAGKYRFFSGWRSFAKDLLVP